LLDAAAARLPYRDNRNKPWLGAKTATAGQALKVRTATEAGQRRHGHRREFILQQHGQGRSVAQDGPFGRPERAVLHCKTAHIAVPRGHVGKWLWHRA
ncbi:MAG TPA: hypothetical protein H9992_03505, partial [Candidatus Prevotella intestinigallinarum]|nr:hypothetical protein [Candidatus Prevotella intestinigallinarum]